MSEELYLIAHKVRGEPAFDIAVKIQIGDEEGWIIPTSGHRAYPWWSIELSELEFYRDDKECSYRVVDCPSPAPADWPDHYSTRAEERTVATNLLSQLGLSKPKVHNAVQGTLRRRI